MDTFISQMEKQPEKWRIERAILSRIDSGTPGYWEMVNILLEQYGVAAIGC